MRWLTSVKCNNQYQDLETHRYKTKFIYRAAIRVQKAEGSAGGSLMSQKNGETPGRGKKLNEYIAAERGESEAYSHMHVTHSSDHTEL